MMEFGGASLLSPIQRPLCQGVVSGSSTLYDTTASGAAACLGMATGTYIDTASVMWMLERSSGARPNLGGWIPDLLVIHPFPQEVQVE